MARKHLIPLLLPVLLASLPAAAVAQEGPIPAPGRGPRFSLQVRQDSVVMLARQQLGRRYVYGGNGPSGFDCSGFTRYLMRAVGVDVPRTAAQQARAGEVIPRDRSLLRPGDILTFGRRGRVSHVGVYVGNGRYIHASSANGRVVEADMSLQSTRLERWWIGVRRF